MNNSNEIGSSLPEKEESPKQEKIREIMKRSKQFIVICGPSGSGKTMAIKHLVDKYGFIEPPFLTTRKLRPGEKEIGGAVLDEEDFSKKETSGEIFLPARNYGNAYGYDLDVIFNSAIEGNNIVVEAPSVNLTTDVAHFLPESTVIGMLPLNTKEIEAQLTERGLNSDSDRKARLSSVETEKENILRASETMSISQITPTHGVPEDTLTQIDTLMEQKRFKAKE